MPHLRTWTTRAHLLLLVLVAVLPALLLLLGSGLELERDASRRATSSLAFQVQEAARAQEQLVDSAHQVLATLATLTRIQQREADRLQNRWKYEDRARILLLNGIQVHPSDAQALGGRGGERGQAPGMGMGLGMGLGMGMGLGHNGLGQKPDG